MNKEIYNRLRRIEGQIRGIVEMVAAGKPEQEILIQLEAAKSSISSTEIQLAQSMLEVSADGKVIIDQDKLISILRLIKR